MNTRASLGEGNRSPMGDKVQRALNRLQRVLPLHKNQKQCDPSAKRLHQQLLHSFVTRSHPLTRAEMAGFVADVPAALAQLCNYDMVTLSADGELTGAYPFTTDDRGHRVQVNGHKVHAMCAVDALAVAPMFRTSTQVTSRCSVTSTPIAIDMMGATVQNGADVQDVHVGIDWAAADGAASCAISLCTEMIFLRDQATAGRWRSKQGDREIFTLHEAIHLASSFFVPLL